MKVQRLKKWTIWMTAASLVLTHASVFAQEVPTENTPAQENAGANKGLYAQLLPAVQTELAKNLVGLIMINERLPELYDLNQKYKPYVEIHASDLGFGEKGAEGDVLHSLLEKTIAESYDSFQQGLWGAMVFSPLLVAMNSTRSGQSSVRPAVNVLTPMIYRPISSVYTFAIQVPAFSVAHVAAHPSLVGKAVLTTEFVGGALTIRTNTSSGNVGMLILKLIPNEGFAATITWYNTGSLNWLSAPILRPSARSSVVLATPQVWLPQMIRGSVFGSAWLAPAASSAYSYHESFGGIDSIAKNRYLSTHSWWIGKEKDMAANIRAPGWAGDALRMITGLEGRVAANVAQTTDSVSEALRLSSSVRESFRDAVVRELNLQFTNGTLGTQALDLHLILSELRDHEGRPAVSFDRLNALAFLAQIARSQEQGEPQVLQTNRQPLDVQAAQSLAVLQQSVYYLDYLVNNWDVVIASQERSVEEYQAALSEIITLRDRSAAFLKLSENK